MGCADGAADRCRCPVAAAAAWRAQPATHLNYWIPLVTPSRTEAGLRVIPWDRLHEKSPRVFNLCRRSGASRLYSLRTCDPETPIDWHRMAGSPTPRLMEYVGGMTGGRPSNKLVYPVFRATQENDFGITLGDILPTLTGEREVEARNAP